MTDEKTQQPTYSEPISISEAARILKRSERTIYRMIRSGEIKCVKMSDKRLTNVILNNHLQPVDRDTEADNSVKMSDTKDNRNQELIQQELREKDHQISKLIDNQKEMLVTIHQLQAQVQELSRWIMDHTSEKNIVRVDTSPDLQETRHPKGLLQRWMKMKIR